MKFILAENKKFVLEERFILQEASIAEVAKKWTAQLEATLDKTEQTLKQYIKYAGPAEADATNMEELKKIKLSIEKTAEDLENTLELPLASLVSGEANTEVKEELGNYIEVLTAAGKAIVKTDDNKDELTLLDKRLEELFTLRSATSPFSGGSRSIENLRKIIKWVNEKIMPLFNIESMSATETSVTEFKELCKECLDLLTDLRVDLPDDFSEFASEDIKTYCKLMPAAVEATQLPVKDINEKKSLLPKLTTYIGYVKTLKDALSKIAKATILDDGATQDWKTKYANAQNKEAVIEEFIYTTWKNDYEAVLKIKKTLLQECDAYGFTDSEKGNPFISYISNIYLKYKIEPELYNIVHNMVATNRLTGADLLGKGSMGQGNLLFCKALYTAGAGAAKLYLKKQYNLLHATKLPEEFETAAEMAFNALYKLSTVVKGEQTKNSINLELRPMAEVEQLEAQWVGQVSDTATDDEKPEKTTATNAELLNQITDTNAAVKVLAALAIKFSSNDQIVAAVQSCKEVKELMLGTTTWDKVQKLVAQEERLYKIAKITATQALNLIKSILDSDKFSLTKE